MHISNGRRRMFEPATLALRKVDSITHLLPDVGIFLYAYILRPGAQGRPPHTVCGALRSPATAPRSSCSSPFRSGNPA